MNTHPSPIGFVLTQWQWDIVHHSNPIHSFDPGIRSRPTRLLNGLLVDVIFANNSYPWTSNHFFFYTSMHLSLSIRLANTHSNRVLNSNPLKSSVWVRKNQALRSEGWIGHFAPFSPRLFRHNTNSCPLCFNQAGIVASHWHAIIPAWTRDQET